MTDEEKLYVLMAQAEDLQKHAVELQNKAQETFSALPSAVEQAGQKIRSTGLLAALLGWLWVFPFRILPSWSVF